MDGQTLSQMSVMFRTSFRFYGDGGCGVVVFSCGCSDKTAGGV